MPLDLRPQKTRKLRRRLTKHQVAKKTLKQMNTLLKKVVDIWPCVEFVSSVSMVD